MQPDILQDVCLYDFIRRFNKLEVSKSKRKDEDSSDEESDHRVTTDNGSTLKFSFLSDHPQFKTHQFYWIGKQYGYIPNFVGGMLPQQDKGDQDYYYCTMLVLFKP